MIRGSSFIALIVETTCSVLILDQSGSPQAQAQAGLICSITVSINTRTRILAVFVIIAPPTLGVCLLGGVWCPSESWPKPIESMWLSTESRCWTLQRFALLLSHPPFYACFSSERTSCTSLAYPWRDWFNFTANRCTFRLTRRRDDGFRACGESFTPTLLTKKGEYSIVVTPTEQTRANRDLSSLKHAALAPGSKGKLESLRWIYPREAWEGESVVGSLVGAVAAVTGAGRGIGRAIAEELGFGGAKVVVNYSRSKEPAEEVVARLSGNGNDQAVAVGADVSKANEAFRLIEETLERFGRIDILVNNAGITIDRTMKKLTVEEWD